MDIKAKENIDALRQTMAGLNGLKFIHSDQAKDLYSNMQDDDFKFDHEKVSAEDAKLLSDLLQLAVITLEALFHCTEGYSNFPTRGDCRNGQCQKRLFPWQRFLNKAAASVTTL